MLSIRFSIQNNLSLFGFFLLKPILLFAASWLALHSGSPAQLGLSENLTLDNISAGFSSKYRMTVLLLLQEEFLEALPVPSFETASSSLQLQRGWRCPLLLSSPPPPHPVLPYTCWGKLPFGWRGPTVLPLIACHMAFPR